VCQTVFITGAEELVKSQLRGRDWVSPEIEWSREELETVLRVAEKLKLQHMMNEETNYLRNKTVALLFFNASLRTRASFETGLTQLGGHGMFITPETIYSFEEVKDTAEVLSRYADGLAIRYIPRSGKYGDGNNTLKQFAKYSTVPIINMECDKFHPCQGMADLLTIKEKFGTFNNKKFVYSWAYAPGPPKPVSVAQTDILLATKFGMEVVLAHPPGFGLDEEILSYAKSCAKENGTKFEIIDDMASAVEGADIVYPKSYCSWKYRQISDQEELTHREKFKEWRMTSELMDKCKKNAIYMHCLPANRKFEVDDDVIDGPHSVVVDQAENRLHAQKALMSLIIAGLP